MVQYTDIVKSVTTILKDNFKLPIYGDEVEEGYKTPSFFVGIYPISSTTQTKNYVLTELMINISYFSNTKDSVRNYNMMNDIKKAFGLVLKVGNRRFTIKELEIEKVENDVFEISFSIEYHELMNFEVEPEPMRELIHTNRKVE